MASRLAVFIYRGRNGQFFLSILVAYRLYTARIPFKTFFLESSIPLLQDALVWSEQDVHLIINTYKVLINRHMVDLPVVGLKSLQTLLLCCPCTCLIFEIVNRDSQYSLPHPVYKYLFPSSGNLGISSS